MSAPAAAGYRAGPRVTVAGGRPGPGLATPPPLGRHAGGCRRRGGGGSLARDKPDPGRRLRRDSQERDHVTVTVTVTSDLESP